MMTSPPTRLGQRLLTAATVASLSAGSVLAFAMPTNVSAQEAHASTANAVPSEAAFFSTINLDLDSEQWLQVDTLLDRVGVPDAIEQGRAGLLEESDGELTEAQLDAVLGGEAGFYVLPSGVEAIVAAYEEAATTALATPEAMEDMDSMDVEALNDIDLSGFGMVLQPSDPDMVWTMLNDAANEPDSDVTVETSTIGDADVLAVTSNEDDFNQTIYVAHSGEYLIFTVGESNIDMAIAAASDEADSLADTDGFQQVIAELPVASASFAFVDSPKVITAIGQDNLDKLTTLSPQAAASLEADYYGGYAIHADDDGFRFDSVNIPLEPGGLAALMPESTVTLDQQVPASTNVFFGGVVPDGAFDSAAFSVAQLINTGMSGEEPDVSSLDEIFTEEYIQGQIADAEQILGFNLLTDFFGLMSGEGAFALTVPDLSAMSSLSVDTVAAMHLEEPATVADSVERLVRLASSMAGDEFPVSTRTEGDSTVYVFGDPATTGIPAIEIGVIGDYFVLGSATGVDAFVNGPDESLADSETYQSTLALLPGSDYYGVAYINVETIVPTVMALSGMGGGGMSSTPDADPACLDYATQAEAQEAFDADPFENSNLDQDFDSEACEDFFAPAAAATPTASGSPEAIKAFAAVNFVDGDNVYSSGILYIPAPSE